MNRDAVCAQRLGLDTEKNSVREMVLNRPVKLIG